MEPGEESSNTVSRDSQGLVSQYLRKESRAGLGTVVRFQLESRSSDKSTIIT